MTMTPPDPDWSGTDFARIIGTLEPLLPISDEFEDDLWQRRSGHDFRPGVDQWWRDQREHLVRWFRDLDFPGYYTRARTRTARQGYGSFRYTPGLVWLGEALCWALDEDADRVEDAVSAALNVGPNPQTQCAAVRVNLPWRIIARQVQQVERRAADLRDQA